MSEPTDELAGRYRRLLAWYPRDHRERHGEEMLGVLLAGAGERTRPSRRETSDLLRGAVHLHLRRAAGLDGGIDHRDVLAIVSLLGPIVMLAGSASVLERLLLWLRAGVGLSWQSAAEITDAPVWGIWFVVALLSLFRMRRTAAAGAWVATFGFFPAASVGYTFFLDEIIMASGWLVLGAVVAAALTWSPGPARGWELVGGPRVAVLAGAVATSVVLVLLSLGTYGVLFQPVEVFTMVYGEGILATWLLAVAVLAAGAAVAAGVRSREGRRAASVLWVPALVTVFMLVLPRGADLEVVWSVCFGLPVVMLLALGSLPRRLRRAS